MPSFSVADLKDRANKLKDVAGHKISTTHARYQSSSSNNYAWDPNVKPTDAPAPPQRTAQSSNNTTSSRPTSWSKKSSPPPPPPSRTSEWSRPSSVTRQDSLKDSSASTPSPPPATRSWAVPKQTTDAPNRVDWTKFSDEDKQVFFAWLDEFFESRLNISIAAKQSAAPSPTVQRTSRPTTPPRPPTLSAWSRPSQQFSAPQEGGIVAHQVNGKPSPDSFTLSFPPPTMHGCSAADLAHYFSPSTHWDSPWYTSSDLPPPLQANAPPLWAAAWEMRGTKKTSFGGALFADLSMCWWSVSFSTAGRADPNDTNAVQRSAHYLTRPSPKDRAALVDAHETYGETIAAFAESFEGTGQYCARGECWDLAAEALKYFEQYDYVPKPVPSLSRTHGHLIFEGRASRKGAEQQGRWRGGDDRVRRGDIVEWRSVRIGMPGGGYAILGDPDHTAVIVSESVPSVQVADGGWVKPSQLGSLEVVEQSVGKPPERQTYNLSMLEEGEVWIYRPIGLEGYVGAVLGPKRPDNVNLLSI